VEWDGLVRDDQEPPLVELDQLMEQLGTQPATVARHRIDAQSA